MKGGILFSEVVNTVSPAVRARDPGPGDGLRLRRPVLRARAGDLVGILNGVDYDEWDPRHDRHIAQRYSPEGPVGQGGVQGRPAARLRPAREPDLPVVGIVSRLVHQKGFDIVVRAWYDLLQRPLRMVVLGTGEPEVQDGFRALAAPRPRPLRRPLRLRRGARPQDRGRLRTCS